MTRRWATPERSCAMRAECCRAAPIDGPTAGLQLGRDPAYTRRRSSYAHVQDCMVLEHGFPRCPNSVPERPPGGRIASSPPRNGELDAVVVDMISVHMRVLGIPLRCMTAVRCKATAVSGAQRVAAIVRPNARREIARWQRAHASADSEDAMRIMHTRVNPHAVARVMQHCTHSDPWRAPRGQTFAEGHHGAERYRHAFSVTMAAFKQAAQALPKTPSRQSLRRPYCGTERQLIGTCTTGTFFGTNDGHGS